jgi:pimeloyl-ACP methyl ester carboxylesterase
VRSEPIHARTGRQSRQGVCGECFRPGLRGFAVYRAFGQDADDNQATLKHNGKLGMPVLAVGGAMSSTGPFVEEMMNEVAENVTGVRIPGASHFIPEENPEAFASAVLDFTGPSSSS